jgi:hypothetical protein
MIVKRMLRTAGCCLAGLGASLGLMAGTHSASADVVTGISNLSQANRLSIFHDYSINAVGLTSGSGVPGSAGGGMMTSILGSWASTDPTGSGRSYDISATPLFGYDSNPEARRVGQGSIFGGTDIAAQYRINVGPDDPTVGSPNQFRFSYDATGTVYDGTVLNADTFQQTFAASYRRSLLHDMVFVGVGFQNQFTTEYGNAFLDTVDVSPSVEWFMLPQASAEVNYDYTLMGYFIHPVTKRDPNADRNTVNAKFHFYPTPQLRGEIPEAEDVLGDILRQSLQRATIGYAAVFNEATGTDYNYEANRLSIGIEGLHCPRMPDLTLDATYSHEWDNYMGPSVEGPNIIAGKPRQIRRKDHLDVFTLRTNARLFDLPKDRGTLSTFVQWDIIADRSNLEARHFNEFVISGGISYRY